MHLTLEIIPKLGIYLLFRDVKGHTSFDLMDEETIRQREKSIFSSLTGYCDCATL